METISKSINTKLAVLSTISYFDIFDIAITREEIIDYLLFLKPEDKNIDIYLKESNILNEFNGFYFINKNRNIHEQFFQKLENSKKYWKKVKRWQFLFSICPFIKLVAVCNSLPINDISKKSDIDLFIVTEKDKIFVARFFITFLLSILALRRHGKKVNSRFCLSFFVDEEKLKVSDVSLKPYDIYLAFWLKTLEPISGDYQTYENIILENKEFMDFYFKSEPLFKKRFFRKRSFIQNKIKNLLEKIINKTKIDQKLKGYQLKKIYSKLEKLENKEGTIISDHILKFHDNDARKKIRELWEEKLKSFT